MHVYSTLIAGLIASLASAKLCGKQKKKKQCDNDDLCTWTRGAPKGTKGTCGFKGKTKNNKFEKKLRKFLKETGLLDTTAEKAFAEGLASCTEAPTESPTEYPTMAPQRGYVTPGDPVDHYAEPSGPGTPGFDPDFDWDDFDFDPTGGFEYPACDGYDVLATCSTLGCVYDDEGNYEFYGYDCENPLCGAWNDFSTMQVSCPCDWYDENGTCDGWEY